VREVETISAVIVGGVVAALLFALSACASQGQEHAETSSGSSAARRPLASLRSCPQVAQLWQEVRSGGAAAIGVPDTLRALGTGRLALLLLEEDWILTGAVCLRCGARQLPAARCAACGALGLQPIPDLLVAARRDAAQRGCAVERVRGDPEFLAAGGIGGLLSQPVFAPAPEEPAGTPPVASPGEG
jgi:hypothetical protein